MISLRRRGAGSAQGLALTLLTVASLGGLFACSTTTTTRYGADGWRIRCGENMSSCASRADNVCRDKGYTVVGGGTQSTMLGGPNGYQSKTRQSELLIRCGEDEGEDVEPLRLPPRSDVEADAVSEAPAATPPAASAPSAAMSCVPGHTQKCIGAGACEGGQACLADGSGYGACDCGGSSAPSASPASSSDASWSGAAPADGVPPAGSTVTPPPPAP